ncbi:MAG: M14 family metallopeptidase, partial [Bacteroidales bacterium]|nr:M14 family metallopeptidase [Bacteroidales bacterium]
MKIRKSLAVRGFVLFIGAGSVFSLPASGIEKYSDPATVNKRIEQISQGSAGLVRVHKMAVSSGGTDVLMMEIGKAGATMPAVLVAANMSGTAPLSTEAALSLASRLAADTKLSTAITWYIIPMGNPDAYARFFMKPLWSDPGNATPFNDDTDDQTDEDGYNDLNNDGLITQIRVKAHDGTWVPLEQDNRLMRRADAAKGEKGIYRLYSEGIDDDGDGQYNEDAPGGTNVNINFPHLFKSFGKRSGLYPGSAPESEALLKFAFAHPEIAMVLSFSSTNFLLAPPQGGRKGSLDTENIRIPREIGTAMGMDVSRTYTMAEIIEMVQPMLPPGMTADESMIASFLGLGAVVNPMQEDLAFYNEISSGYKDYLKKRGVTEERFDPAQPEDGSFELWAYYHLGLPVFSMDLWALPKPKEEKKEASGLTIESLEKMSSDEFLALGEDKINAFLKERGAPAQYNATMVMGMVKSGQVKPAQMATMMKQMPAPAADEKKGDPKEMAQLAFSDKWLEGKGFVPWKTFSHPSLGEAEIGGFAPFSDNTPPAVMVDSLLDLHLPYVFELVKKLPSLKIAEAKVTGKGGGVYQIEAWITNEGYLPFPTAMGKRNKVPAPAILTLDGAGMEILSGKKRTPVNDLGGMKSARYVWLVRSAGKSSVSL